MSHVDSVFNIKKKYSNNNIIFKEKGKFKTQVIDLP